MKPIPLALALVADWGGKMSEPAASQGHDPETGIVPVETAKA